MNSHENNENKINQSPFSFLQKQNGRAIAEQVLSFLSNTDLKNLKLTSKDDYQFTNIEIEKRKVELNKQFLNPNDALSLIYTSSPREIMKVIASYQSTEAFKLLKKKYNNLMLNNFPALNFRDVDQILGENTIKLNHSSIKELADINTDIFNLKYENKISPIEIICLTLSMDKVCRRMSPRILLDALICFEPILQYLKKSSEEIDFFYWNLITTLKACIFMLKDIEERNSPFIITLIIRQLKIRANNLSDSYLNLSGIYLNLKDFNFNSDILSLRNINFSHSELRRWFGRFDLSFSNLRNCTLIDNIFMEDSVFHKTDLSYASLEGHENVMFSPRLIDTKFNHAKGEFKILDNANNMFFDRINFACLEAKIEFKFSSKKALFDNCVFLVEQLVNPNDFKKTLDQLANSFASLKAFDVQKQSFCRTLAKNILDCLSNRNTQTKESIESILKLVKIAIDHKIFNDNLVKKFTTKGKKLFSDLFHKESSLSGKEMLKLYKKDLKNIIKSRKVI